MCKDNVCLHVSLCNASDYIDFVKERLDKIKQFTEAGTLSSINFECIDKMAEMGLLFADEVKDFVSNALVEAGFEEPAATEENPEYVIENL